MPVRVAGIQPGYLPWLGYFDQMARVDAFIVANEMPYSSSGWSHRNRVKGPQGAHWLTLPHKARLGQRIGDVALDVEQPWKRKHMETLRHFYKDGPESAALLADLDSVLDESSTTLGEPSTATVHWLAGMLDVRTPILLSSDLGLERAYRERFPDEPGPTHRIVAFLEQLGATELVGGESGNGYFDRDVFAAHGMTAHFYRYPHPVYPQLHGAFVSHLSALDLLLCVGRDEAAAVVASSARSANA